MPHTPSSIDHFHNAPLHLHIISFQVPYPPSYGGVIDVYFKLKALKEIGCHITLHTYRYRLPEAPELNEVADEVYYYERYTGVASQCACKPYIVYSRRNQLLLERLCNDTDPILLEGLHNCYFLNHPSLAHRIRVVRAHNVEHHYYMKLGKAAFPRPQSFYFFLEAAKLKRFEPVLHHADALLAITEEEQAYFEQHYPDIPSHIIPCFFDEGAMQTADHQPVVATKPYMLYHGNLSVAENIHAALYLLKEVLPLLPPERQTLVIAGKDPASELVRQASKNSRVTLLPNPTDPEMDRLIQEARIHVLPTFQNTGFKLKLIHALTKGYGHCVANTPMLSDPALKRVCQVADSPQEWAEAIDRCADTQPTPSERAERLDFLHRAYNNKRNAEKIVSIVKQLQANQSKE